MARKRVLGKKRTFSLNKLMHSGGYRKKGKHVRDMLYRVSSGGKSHPQLRTFNQERQAHRGVERTFYLQRVHLKEGERGGRKARKGRFSVSKTDLTGWQVDKRSAIPERGPPGISVHTWAV